MLLLIHGLLNLQMDIEGRLYIDLKKNEYTWTYIVQARVVKGSTANEIRNNIWDIHFPPNFLCFPFLKKPIWECFESCKTLYIYKGLLEHIPHYLTPSAHSAPSLKNVILSHAMFSLASENGVHYCPFSTFFWHINSSVFKSKFRSPFLEDFTDPPLVPKTELN